MKSLQGCIVLVPFTTRWLHSFVNLLIKIHHGGVLKTAVRPNITVCPVSFISSYSQKYSSILPKLIQSLRCLSQPSPRPLDKTACRKWLWGDCLSRATEQGNKAASVIKIRAVFTGSDRHQTPTLDWERAGWGGREGEGWGRERHG